MSMGTAVSSSGVAATRICRSAARRSALWWSMVLSLMRTPGGVQLKRTRAHSLGPLRVGWMVGGLQAFGHPRLDRGQRCRHGGRLRAAGHGQIGLAAALAAALLGDEA